MERVEAVRRLMGYVDQVRVNTIKSVTDDLEFAFEVGDVFMALDITTADIDAAREVTCGVVNPRTHMVCNMMPHTSLKHWTIAPDGQSYDWYEHEPHD